MRSRLSIWLISSPTGHHHPNWSAFQDQNRAYRNAAVCQGQWPQHRTHPPRWEKSRLWTASVGSTQCRYHWSHLLVDHLLFDAMFLAINPASSSHVPAAGKRQPHAYEAPHQLHVCLPQPRDPRSRVEHRSLQASLGFQTDHHSHGSISTPAPPPSSRNGRDKEGSYSAGRFLEQKNWAEQLWGQREVPGRQLQQWHSDSKDMTKPQHYPDCTKKYLQCVRRTLLCTRDWYFLQSYYSFNCKITNTSTTHQIHLVGHDVVPWQPWVAWAWKWYTRRSNDDTGSIACVTSKVQSTWKVPFLCDHDIELHVLWTNGSSTEVPCISSHSTWLLAAEVVKLPQKDPKRIQQAEVHHGSPKNLSHNIIKGIGICCFQASDCLFAQFS